MQAKQIIWLPWLESPHLDGFCYRSAVPVRYGSGVWRPVRLRYIIIHLLWCISIHCLHTIISPSTFLPTSSISYIDQDYCTHLLSWLMAGKKVDLSAFASFTVLSQSRKTFSSPPGGSFHSSLLRSVCIILWQLLVHRLLVQGGPLPCSYTCLLYTSPSPRD